MTRKQNGRKRIEFNRRKFLQTATVAGVGVSGVTAFSGSAVAQDCDVVVPDDESKIQDGVNASGSGDTVCVKNGTYIEQVVINKDLTLTNKDGHSPTIEAPSSPSQFTIAESGWTWEPIVFAFGGSESGGDVSGPGTVDVNISGFTVDGNNREPTDANPSTGLIVRSAGILQRNVNGEVGENTVKKMRVADTGPFSHSLGIATYGDSDVSISDNTVKEYARIGIFVTGDAGTGVPDPDGTIHRNEVTGHDNDSAAVPLGVQLSFGATGEIQGNTVQKNKASEGEGVVIVDSEDVPIAMNTIKENETSVVIGSVNVFGLTPHLKAENNKVNSNDISGISGSDHAEEGVFLWSAEDDGSVDNTKVVNNDISEHEDGVVITTPDDGATAENVKIIRNTFSDIDDENIDTGGATEEKVHANV